MLYIRASQEEGDVHIIIHIIAVQDITIVYTIYAAVTLVNIRTISHNVNTAHIMLSLD